MKYHQPYPHFVRCHKGLVWWEMACRDLATDETKKLISFIKKHGMSQIKYMITQPSETQNMMFDIECGLPYNLQSQISLLNEQLDDNKKKLYELEIKYNYNMSFVEQIKTHFYSVRQHLINTMYSIETIQPILTELFPIKETAETSIPLVKPLLTRYKREAYEWKSSDTIEEIVFDLEL